MIDLGVVYKARTVVETIEHLLRHYGELPANSVSAVRNPMTTQGGRDELHRAEVPVDCVFLPHTI